MRLVRSGVGGGGMIDASTSGAIDTSASVAMRSLFAVSLSLSSIFLGWKSFEGKMETEIHFRLGRAILRSTWKLISI